MERRNIFHKFSGFNFREKACQPSNLKAIYLNKNLKKYKPEKNKSQQINVHQINLHKEIIAAK
ncbi:MAG: hypothetical protein A2W05_00160 [Candidatus Schekmanbacteria bacterium RBG_16_38_10]|uniref:Uncharacterized protein n=1 Tax=Candidatus Schekmanbacteria bacterium RBG_16_38_10 TaxID=1817879 RepID=A0A1F7RPB4_9BACT|nr:MAG: hypothetical protein A2W05_00160 [Candidatus Schekmanbacteria bacterium RBG_16_38_10]